MSSENRIHEYKVIRKFLESDNVYAAILKEREYQDKRWGKLAPWGGVSEVAYLPARHELASFLVYIESYVNEGKELLSRNDDKDSLVPVQHILRKIAALAVAAMEQHGVAFREEK